MCICQVLRKIAGTQGSFEVAIIALYHKCMGKDILAEYAVVRFLPLIIEYRCTMFSLAVSSGPPILCE